MNIVLWVLQSLIAFQCLAGALWRIMNYDQAAKDIPSVQALPQAAWVAIGAFEILAALGLILPGLFKMKPGLTAAVAAALAVEMLLVSALHLSYFGFELRATNPAMWTIMLCALSAFVAYGRTALSPL